MSSLQDKSVIAILSYDTEDAKERAEYEQKYDQGNLQAAHDLIDNLVGEVLDSDNLDNPSAELAEILGKLEERLGRKPDLDDAFGYLNNKRDEIQTRIDMMDFSGEDFEGRTLHGDQREYFETLHGDQKERFLDEYARANDEHINRVEMYTAEEFAAQELSDLKDAESLYGKDSAEYKDALEEYTQRGNEYNISKQIYDDYQKMQNGAFSNKELETSSYGDIPPSGMTTDRVKNTGIVSFINQDYLEPSGQNSLGLNSVFAMADQAETVARLGTDRPVTEVNTVDVVKDLGLEERGATNSGSYTVSA